MGFLRRLAGILGFVGKDNDGGHEVKDEEDDGNGDGNFRNRDGDNLPRFQETGMPRKGFGVPVKVVVERGQPGPVILPCSSGSGGVQGLRWCSQRLRIDEDGDAADEFLDEVLPESSASAEHHAKPLPRLEVKHNTRPAKVKGQMVSSDGKLQQCVEHHGRIQWV